MGYFYLSRDKCCRGKDNGNFLRALSWVAYRRAFLTASDGAAGGWLEGFAATFLERDIPQLGLRVPPEALRRFWMMNAHDHGQIWNAAEGDRSL